MSLAFNRMGPDDGNTRTVHMFWFWGGILLVFWGQAVSSSHDESDYVRLCDAFCSKMKGQSEAGASSVCGDAFEGDVCINPDHESQPAWAELGKFVLNTRIALTWVLFMRLPPLVIMISQRWDGTAEQLTCCLTINRFHPHSTFTNNFPICPKLMWDRSIQLPAPI